MRPTKLDDDLQAKLLDRLRIGTPVESACASVGISASTHYNWMDLGRSELARVEANPRASVRKKYAPYVEYLEAVEKAQTEAHVRNLGIVHAAAQGGRDLGSTEYVTYHADGTVKSRRTETKRSAPQWQAAAWYLERRLPHLYARTFKGEITGRDGGPIEGIALTKDEYAEVLRDNVGKASHLIALFEGEDDLT